jgi:hypothetical protein
MKCDHDLADCTCPDLEERLNALRNCKHIHVPTMVEKPLLERKLKAEQPEPKKN